MKKKHNLESGKHERLLLVFLVFLISAMIILPSGCLDSDNPEETTSIIPADQDDKSPDLTDEYDDPYVEPSDDSDISSETTDVSTIGSSQSVSPSFSSGGGSSGSSSSTVAVTGISINQADQTVYAGETLQLTVTFAPTTASNKALSWTSNDTNVATVGSSSGLVTNVASGVANITATSADGGYTDSVIITVTETPIVNSAAELQAAIGANGVTSITLGADLTGDVTATRTGSTSFDIDFGTYVLTGDLTITANSVTTMSFTGSAVPAITGDLTVSASNATVTNGISVGGTITVSDVGSHSWIELADDNTITLTDSNGASIVIQGNPADITIEDGADGINITADSPVNITVSNGATVNNIIASAAGTVITNNGVVSNVTSNVDISIENNGDDINVDGTGTIGVSGSANITGTAPRVTGISSVLGLDQAELRIGDVTVANITGVSLAGGEAFNVTSADATIVSVDTITELNITAQSPGRTAITVQVQNSTDVVIKQGTIFVTVLPVQIDAASATIVAPAAGVTPATAAQIEAATVNADYTVASVTWNEDLTAAGKFKAGQVYNATVVLTSKNNKAFQQAAFTPTVVGSDSVGQTTTLGTSVGNRVTFTVTFPATDALEVSSIAVTTQPTKMTYKEVLDDILVLNGMVVTETYNDGTTNVVAFTDGTASGYTTNPVNGSTLTNAGHNGNPVAVTHDVSTQSADTGNLVVDSTSIDADLSALSVNPGSLNEVFVNNTLSYTVDVYDVVSSLNVTATLSDAGASMTINGEAAVSDVPMPVTLNASGQSTMIEIEVIAEDETTTKIYDITVTRVAIPAILSANVSITEGSAIFGYEFFSDEAGATPIDYTTAQADPYYLNTTASTVRLVNSSYETADIPLSSLGIGVDGNVTYENLTEVEAAFGNPGFVDNWGGAPTHIVLNLTGGQGGYVWTFDTVIEFGQSDMDAFESIIPDIGDTTQLSADIVTAQALHDGATEGTALGNYAVGSKTTLQSAIDAAQAVVDADPASTTSEVSQGETDLAAAVSTFESGEVV